MGHKVSHEEAVEFISDLDKATDRLERKLSQRGHRITSSLHELCLINADRMMLAKFGFQTVDLFD